MFNHFYIFNLVERQTMRYQMDNKTRISELENEIKKNQDAYYNNEALISDAEFDALMDELKELDPDNALLTTEVGSDHIEGFKKAKHTILMGSQAKANTEAEMNKFIGGIDASLCLGQFKMDGCLDYSTILETDKGKLTIGEIVENRIECNVKAFNFEKNEIIFTPIKNWFINDNNFKWYELELDDGRKLKVTGNHKVWVTNKNAWIEVENLEEGDDFIVD